MELLRARVLNYRSAEDTGWFKLSRVTCLVGKNEAGKTAVLHALASLNPHPTTPVVLDRERDYPRRYLNDYAGRHPNDAAIVVQTEWAMTEAERDSIASEFGKASIAKVPDDARGGELVDEPVLISRRYGAAQPEWELPIDYAEAAAHLMDEEQLNEGDREPLGTPAHTDALHAALQGLQLRSEAQDRLLARLDKMPGKTVRGRVLEILGKGFPHFLYFSHYDRMAGQIRFDDLAQRLSANKIDSGDQLFLDFLKYAGTSAEEISAAQTYEDLNAKCESASANITDKLLDYWTQNPNIEVEIRVTIAEPNDPAPFNAGIIGRARVRNILNRVTVPFSERGAGFVWFFSFLVKFAQVESDATPAVILLDEPGLTLHGRAQADLLRYVDEQLAPRHQVAYTTHSPFMVPAERLRSVRIVEDRVVTSGSGRRQPEGTKVREDLHATDPDTLFPLQGAFGYEVTQTLFIGKHTVLVEGPSDILFLKVWSSALRKRGRTQLDPRWTICPAGGIDRIQSFVALFAGRGKLDVAALTNHAPSDRKRLDALRHADILATGRFLSFATLLGRSEADAEDVFTPELYAAIVNRAFSLAPSIQLTVEMLQQAQPVSLCLVKQVQTCFRVMPLVSHEFDRYRPAEWLLLNPQALDMNDDSVTSTLDRAEMVIKALNALLPPA